MRRNSSAMPDARPALFLDRDGVVNEDLVHVHRREDFRFIDGVFDLAGAARARGHAVVIVTNQAGIGRGLYSESQFQALMDWVRGEFAARDAAIDAVYHCPFHPVHGIGEYRRESEDRKPGPGMILRAARELQLDLGSSLLVGDRPSDMQAAVAAGVGRALLLGPPERAPGFTAIASLREAIAHLKEAP